jgi:hypothetical protein
MVLQSGVAMVPDLDIWRAANLLIRKHGANAELEAAKRADLMLERGDDEGRLVWARIRGRSSATGARHPAGCIRQSTVSRVARRNMHRRAGLSAAIGTRAPFRPASWHRSPMI